MSDMLQDAAIESAVLAHFQIISLRKDESSAKRIKASKMCGMDREMMARACKCGGSVLPPRHVV